MPVGGGQAVFLADHGSRDIVCLLSARLRWGIIRRFDARTTSISSTGASLL